MNDKKIIDGMENFVINIIYKEEKENIFNSDSILTPKEEAWEIFQKDTEQKGRKPRKVSWICSYYAAKLDVFSKLLCWEKNMNKSDILTFIIMMDKELAEFKKEIKGALELENE